MTLKIVIKGDAGAQFRKNLAGLKDRFDKAIEASANMAASMIRTRVELDIANAGNFSAGNLADSIQIQVTGSLDKMRVSMMATDPRVSVFESGGVVQGNPLLWIPISGTDAVGIPPKMYGGGLFSARYPRRSGSGAPLLFALSDKLPRYFGIEQVTMPKLFHIHEIVQSVMGNFRQIFDANFRGR